MSLPNLSSHWSSLPFGQQEIAAQIADISKNEVHEAKRCTGARGAANDRLLIASATRLTFAEANLWEQIWSSWVSVLLLVCAAASCDISCPAHFRGVDVVYQMDGSSEIVSTVSTLTESVLGLRVYRWNFARMCRARIPLFWPP